MNIFRYKFVFIPLVFVVVLFLLDKIFLLPKVRENFMQPGGMVYYKQREMQLDKLERFLSDGKKNIHTGIVMGDSRSFALGNVVLNYIGRPDIQVLNFAGPQALPIYHAYLAEKIFTRPVRPEFLILEVSQDSFNKNSGILFSPNMNWGISGEFLERYADRIEDRDRERFDSSRRFALPGMQFSLKYLIGRIKNTIKTPDTSGALTEVMLLSRTFKGAIDARSMPGVVAAMMGTQIMNWDVYQAKNSPHIKVLGYLDGAQYSWFGFMSDEELKKETEKLAGIYLKRYEVSDDQFFFLEKTLKHARDGGVRTIIFLPQINPYMKEFFDKTEKMKAVKERIRRTVEKYDAVFIDMNDDPEAACSQFYDASHLSINCFPDITRALLKKLESQQYN